MKPNFLEHKDYMENNTEKHKDLKWLVLPSNDNAIDELVKNTNLQVLMNYAQKIADNKELVWNKIESESESIEL